jgi:hypothetical protein
MINRRANPVQKTLFSEKPNRSNSRQTGYHFGYESGFQIKVTTLGKTQLAHLAQFLGLGENAFQAIKSVNQGHSDRFWSAEDISWQLRSESNSTRTVMAGEIVEIHFQQTVEKLYSAAFCEPEMEISEN